MENQTNQTDFTIGLFSCTYIMKKLSEHVSQLLEKGDTETLDAFILVDIYRFAYINNIYGFKTGDDLLKSVGKTIKRILKSTDIIDRVNADTFGIILTNLCDKKDVIEFINKLKTELKRPFEVNGNIITVSVQIGIMLIPQVNHSSEQGITAEEVYTNADVALSEAKKGPEWNYVFFNDELKAKTMKFLHYKALLEKAFDEDEFLLYYQPYFYTNDLCIAGFEALTRWKSKKHGHIPPMHFIPILEETGLIMKLETWMINQICKDLKRINNTKFATNKMMPASINISPISFKHEDIYEKITKIISWHKNRDKSTERDVLNQINIEITESTLLEDTNKIITTLEKLKSFGFRISIDDFGTGYSSFSYLKDLPIAYLKIDISFVRHILNDKKSRSITKSIIDLAHNLEMKTIAEGVETKEQFELLKSLGCDIIQGFWLAKPIPIDELINFIEKWEEEKEKYLQ